MVDEHPLWLDTIQQVVEPMQIRVLAKATRSSRALTFVSERAPDLLITGIRMPEGEMDGISLIREALQLAPTMKAIVLSMYEDRARTSRLLSLPEPCVRAQGCKPGRSKVGDPASVRAVRSFWRATS